MNERHCGICHELTNQEFCATCSNRSTRMSKEINELLKVKRKQSDIIKQLILTAGAWRDSGGKDKHLERQFSHLLNELRWVAGTTPEGALDLLLVELGEAGVAA